MADITVSLTDAQTKVVRRLDANKSARQVVQAHIDTWLAPHVAELEEIDRRDFLLKLEAATPAVRDQVKVLLGL